MLNHSPTTKNRLEKVNLKVCIWGLSVYHYIRNYLTIPMCVKSSNTDLNFLMFHTTMSIVFKPVVWGLYLPFSGVSYARMGTIYL